ncbi:GIY-YIG nuclease family protein [aff. Roholtiella sp. LEGE 12411]|uniref:GIY-YIG nuclease family protein n=1 Tax=aff. Roholtiella sp. LEGE 12411 TaxID=1828822 RepID=UPI00187F52DA|nr:GIY-YIG nuclease family protein [aff. Roholtiella sp. LEGE 12411]MBE9038117.1 GIY-YIG nuclease family protein [aff. Roholtiella sp. LEGE 12411]
MTRYYQAYPERNDHQPGYCYLIEAVGFHGWIPGCYFRRVKIGLTRNISRRLEGLALNQPPCDYKVVALIQVENMASVESLLHNKFQHCRVKLEKSREYFDLNPVDYAYCLWLFRRLNQQSISIPFTFRQIAATVFMAASLATMAFPVIQKSFQPANQPIPESKLRG